MPQATLKALIVDTDFRSRTFVREALSALGDELRFALITSKAALKRGEEGIAAEPSADPKCERCWHYVPDVGLHAEHPGLCGRCFSNLAGDGETRTRA